MPRQAIYTLASRTGDLEKKQELIKNYQGKQTKQELLSIIRKLFPLSADDKRQPNLADQIISLLKKLKSLISHPLFQPTEEQRDIINKFLKKIKL
jgi:hypothetical protein